MRGKRTSAIPALVLLAGLAYSAHAQLPPGWGQVTFDASCINSGSATYYPAGDRWEVRSNGAEHYVYTRPQGDFEITVRLESDSGGIRIREGLTSKHITLEISNHTALFGWGPDVYKGTVVPMPICSLVLDEPLTLAPIFSRLQIQRRGGTFIGYAEVDRGAGLHWELQGSVDMPMSIVNTCAGIFADPDPGAAIYRDVSVRDLNEWTVSGDNMYCAAPGNVGIGTSEPTEKLDVNGTVRVRGLGAGGGATVVADDNGKLWKQSSSRRYKNDIQKIETDAYRVLDLEPVRFRWNTTGEPDIGLIAEDVAAVLGDLVLYDRDGRPDGVKYDRLALYLLSVAKAQQEKLEAAQAECESLAQRVKALEQAAQASRQSVVQPPQVAQ
jgi:hypothetical protein